MLLSDRAQFALAVRLRTTGATLGEIYSFISGLYFRGKITYASRFLNPPPGVPGVHVITPSAGLVSPDRVVTLEELRDISSGDVNCANLVYRSALIRDALVLRQALLEETEVVLLGSIATDKYLEPLLEIFGDRLRFPEQFVWRGDMSRGGLLLRSWSDNTELAYVEVTKAVRIGKRPAKLAPLQKPRGRAAGTP